MPGYRATVALLALLIAPTALAACEGDDPQPPRAAPAGPIRPDPAAGEASLVVGYGRSLEQRVLAEIHAGALRAAGYRAETARVEDPRGALQRAEIDAYPARTGRPPRPDPGTVAGDPTGYDSGMAVAVPGSEARKRKLENLSDLAERSRRLSVSGPRGCDRRRDCLPALERAYGVRVRRFRGVRPDLRHEPLRHRRVRAGVVHSTDPQLIRNGLVVLRDDRRAFPPAAWSLFVREGANERRVSALGGRAVRPLSAQVMQELLARVLLDARPPSEVAGEYLRRSGLVR